MLRESLADPFIFAFVSAHDDDQGVSCCVIGVEKIRQYFEKPQASRENDQCIFGSEKMINVLLKLLSRVLEERNVSGLRVVGDVMWTYQRK